MLNQNQVSHYVHDRCTAYLCQRNSQEKPMTRRSKGNQKYAEVPLCEFGLWLKWANMNFLHTGFAEDVIGVRITCLDPEGS